MIKVNMLNSFVRISKPSIKYFHFAKGPFGSFMKWLEIMETEHFEILQNELLHFLRLLVAVELLDDSNSHSILVRKENVKKYCFFNIYIYIYIYNVLSTTGCTFYSFHLYNSMLELYQFKIVLPYIFENIM